MIIDVDMGNSRLKWRSSNSLEQVHVCLDENQAAQQWKALRGIARLRIASVVSDCRLQSLLTKVRKMLHLEAEVARVKDGFAGLHVAYADPSQFGVDRWLGLHAAKFQFPHADLIYISAGTALTVDYLAGSGQHLGGYIVPGWRLASEALLRGAAGINGFTPSLQNAWQPGSSTLDCVESGLGCMYGNFLRAVVQPDRAGFHPQLVIVSGGDAELRAALRAEQIRHTYAPALVLDGLAVVLP